MLRIVGGPLGHNLHVYQNDVEIRGITDLHIDISARGCVRVTLSIAKSKLDLSAFGYKELEKKSWFHRLKEALCL